MDTNKNTQVLSEASFDTHPLWRVDDETEVYYPITSPAEFPEYDRDVLVAAKFYSPMGMIFKGYLVGGANLYCIGLFWNSQEFMFNKNLPGRCSKTFEKLIKALHPDKKILIQDIFPLKYETTIELEGYTNISGKFDAFEKIKDKG